MYLFIKKDNFFTVKFAFFLYNLTIKESWSFVMRIIIPCFLLFFALLFPTLGFTAINVGIGTADLTPPVGTPSAGYAKRQGKGMEGVHDPLLASALFIDNGEQKLVLCSVDHLGFTYEMVQEIIKKIHAYPELKESEIFVASSHTHSGGGAFINIPLLAPGLAGNYDPNITQFYIERTCEAILQAHQNQTPAKIGIGYGETSTALSKYRGLWPKDLSPLNFVTVIKITYLDDRPLAALFNFPVHPTVLPYQNLLFSADFVGYARAHIQFNLGSKVQPLYFNGAQGDIVPVIFNEEDRFDACNILGRSLAETVKAIWDNTTTSDHLQIFTQKEAYSFKPQATPFGLDLPIKLYSSEVNLIVFNKVHAFITIPGELSCFYDKRIKEIGSKLGFEQVSIFGLTNDAHGYIISPEAWKNKAFESRFSFGGEEYGELIQKKVEMLLKATFPLD